MLTSLISSTAKYASVGIPSCSGRTSTMTMTGRWMYRLNRSLISWSDARSFGPEWYHPIIFSRAEREGARPA
jgi:hypothetical protein